MAIQITLTDEDYATLSSASQQSGVPVETLVHEAIAARYPQPTQQTGSYIYPTGEPDTPEEEAEEEAIAQRIGPQKPWLSEMVIEDRGPR